MSNNDNAAVYHSIPAVAALNKVPQFDPVKLLRRVVSEDGKESLVLDLPYKKLWFRLAYPKGKVKLKPLRITEQMAIFEAQVFLSKDDTEPIGNFTASVLRSQVSNGNYVQAAQDAAVSKALEDAGFGIQLSDMAAQEALQYNADAIPVTTASPHSQIVAAPKVQQSPVKAAVKPDPVPPAATVQQEDKQIPVAASAPVAAEPKLVIQPVATAVPQVTPAEKTEPAQKAAANEALDILLKRVTAVTEQPQTPEASAAPKYTRKTPVDEIIQQMSLEDAKAVVVDEGICRGMTMEEVAAKRVFSVRFFLSPGYTGDNNIMRAAAKIVLDNLAMQKAS